MPLRLATPHLRRAVVQGSEQQNRGVLAGIDLPQHAPKGAGGNGGSLGDRKQMDKHDETESNNIFLPNEFRVQPSPPPTKETHSQH